jgi:uncharacterized membrane protein
MGRVEQSIEVNAPIDLCYQVWSNFEQFPRFMKNVESIRRKGNANVWQWTVKGPLGKHVTWDAEVDALRPNSIVSWHSVRNAEVDNSGAVTFKELNMGRTRVDVVISYEPPAGGVGEFVADIFSNPEKMIKEDLANFKNLVEQEAKTYSSTTAGLGQSPEGTRRQGENVETTPRRGVGLGSALDEQGGIIAPDDTSYSI